MTTSFPLSTRAVVLTISDRCSAGTQVDRSGPAVVEILRSAGLTGIISAILPDELDRIAHALRHHSASAELIFTTGGTGLAPRDVTPEATRLVCDRLVDGLAEMMRSEGLKQTPMAPLSRAVCGCLGATLICNLPGSLNGAETSLRTILPLLPHALALLAGSTDHAPAAPSQSPPSLEVKSENKRPGAPSQSALSIEVKSENTHPGAPSQSDLSIEVGSTSAGDRA